MNKQIIKQRKQAYGNNFPKIADYWSKYLNIDISPKDVAMMMAEMKQVRIEQSTNDKAIEDSTIDRDNYLWIGTNYREYEEL